MCTSSSRRPAHRRHEWTSESVVATARPSSNGTASTLLRRLLDQLVRCSGWSSAGIVTVRGNWVQDRPKSWPMRWPDLGDTAAQDSSDDCLRRRSAGQASLASAKECRSRGPSGDGFLGAVDREELYSCAEAWQPSALSAVVCMPRLVAQVPTVFAQVLAVDSNVAGLRLERLRKLRDVAICWYVARPRTLACGGGLWGWAGSWGGCCSQQWQ